MKRYFSFCLLGLSLIVALLAACGGMPALPPTPTGPTAVGPVTDYATFVSALQAACATVVSGGTVQQPFFTPIGQVAKVNGIDMQVFEFQDAASAKAAAQLVAKDGGSVGTSMVDWVAPPHFYGAGKIIVLYVGSDANVKAALNSALGSQFAGR